MTETQNLLAAARSHMTPNYRPPPFVVSHGKGATLWDLEGGEYLDFGGGIGVSALGHSHPRVVEAITSQAAKLCHTSNMFHHAGYIEVCRELTELSFGERVFLSNSGTEAVEAAFKLARRHFHDRGDDRTGFVAAERSFHGRTYGAITATGQPAYQKGFGPMLPDVSHVPFGEIDALAKTVDRSTAAVILEPIQGNAGVIIPPPGYLKAVRELCDTTGCLLIFDEVQTGIGRTGKWFAHEHEAVTPDIMTLAKALGGGLPLGALVTTKEIAEAFQPGTHASTFGGNPVACAAGLATLDVIRTEKILESTQEKGERLRAALVESTAGNSNIIEIRGRGLMIGMQLQGEAMPVQQRCLEAGLLTNIAGPNVLRLLPPLIITDAEIERATDIISAAL